MNCETCGAKVTSYQLGCPGCGAPNCCQPCCNIANLERERDELRAELASLRADKIEAKMDRVKADNAGRCPVCREPWEESEGPCPDCGYSGEKTVNKQLAALREPDGEFEKALTEYQRKHDKFRWTEARELVSAGSLESASLDARAKVVALHNALREELAREKARADEVETLLLTLVGRGAFLVGTMEWDTIDLIKNRRELESRPHPPMG